MTIHAESAPLGLFQAYGVELEYMIVDTNTLDVRPLADQVLKQIGGEYLTEVALGEMAWSNELALHVIEIKTNGPSPSLAPLAERFQQQVEAINELLRPRQSMLLPTAMHPWMDPQRDLELWPHESNVIYETFDRIFDCSGHGWANLQSAHLNLPFGGDQEFGRLHAAIRLILPLLPALAASSPVVDGQLTGLQDTRLDVYRRNASRIPAVTARVIPEQVFSEADYRREILQPLYDAIAPFDPQGVLQHEWLNARGAIARFERSAIEIRVLDVQECPHADLAIAHLVAQTLQALCAERWTATASQRECETDRLVALLDRTICDAERALVDDPHLLEQLGQGPKPLEAGELWQRLAAEVIADTDPARRGIRDVLDSGPLSRRISRALEKRTQLDVYTQLAHCLATGRPLVAA